EVTVGPVEKGVEAVPVAGQVDEVDEEPAQPAEETGQSESSEAARQLCYPGVPPDDRHRPGIFVDEGLRGIAAQLPQDLPSRMLAVLDGHLSALRIGTLVRSGGTGGISRNERTRMPRYREVVGYFHAIASSEFDAQSVQQGVPAHACCPNRRLGGNCAAFI